MKLETLKGTKDYEPREQIRVNKILDIIRKNFEKFGFRPFDTPIIELMSVLTYKYEDDAEIVGEIFKLSDRGNRDLGLRYDLTTPLTRFIASKKQLKLPFKRYQIGRVFRDGPIKKGRLREFIQCDGDIIGVSGIEIEAEILNLFYNTYNDLGINSIIELNNNKILRGSFLQFGFKERDLSSLILSIDKLKKIGIEGVLNEIREKGFNEDNVKEAIKILNSKNFEEIKKFARNDLLKEGISELEKLSNYLKELNINFRINFSMSRGLDIYTGNIWEVYEENGIISSSIGSGGRYDKIIGEYLDLNEKKEIPALGISFGLIPILSVLEEIDKKEKNGLKETLTNILVIPLKSDFFIKSLEIANYLREKGRNVEVFYDYKLKKAFSYCDYLGIGKIIVIGENEIKTNKFILKDLKTKKEEILKI